MNVDKWLSHTIRRRTGIVFVLLGTILLAYSLETQSLRGLILEWRLQGAPTPSGATIIQWKFYGGLICVALGSLLQW